MLETISNSIEASAVSVSTLLLFLLPILPESLPENPSYIMIFVGFAGQGLFAARFVVQWLKSESVGKSVIPVAFWYFSISGGLVLLCYALWRKDPVIIAGQSLGLSIYLRNLYFIMREKRGAPATQNL